MAKKEPEGLGVRYSLLLDESYLQKWLEEKENIRYFPMTIGREVTTSAKNWIGFAKYNASLTATLDNVPVGIATLFLMPYIKTSHHALFYILVDQEKRGQGIGSALIRNILNLAKNYFHLESIHAEVFEGSPIISLLQKFQFTPFATQPHFVKLEEGQYLSRILLEHVFKKGEAHGRP